VGASGPDHHKTFTVEVSLNGQVVGTGNGSSKKRAEQDAAREAIARLFPGE
jgi:ribonuclease-3